MNEHFSSLISNLQPLCSNQSSTPLRCAANVRKSSATYLRWVNSRLTVSSPTGSHIVLARAYCMRVFVRGGRGRRALRSATARRARPPAACAQATPASHSRTECCTHSDGVRALLGLLVQAMIAAETGIRDDTTIEALHQFRVAMRRIRILLDEIKGVLAADCVAQIRAELR